MRSLRTKLLYGVWALLLPALLWGANQTINRVPTTTGSGAATYNQDMDAFLRQEDANRQGELPLFPEGVVALNGGGLHGTSASMTSPPFATTAYTSAGNRLTQPSSVINYATQGCGPAATAWVIASGQTADIVGSFHRVPGSPYYTDCISGPTNQPALPADSLYLMQVMFAGGQIAQVQDLAVRSPTTTSGAGAPCPATATVQMPDTGDIVVDNTPSGVTVLLANPKRCQAIILNNGTAEMRCAPVTVAVSPTVGFPIKAGQAFTLGAEGREFWRCTRTTSTTTAAAIAETVAP